MPSHMESGLLAAGAIFEDAPIFTENALFKFVLPEIQNAQARIRRSRNEQDEPFEVDVSMDVINSLFRRFRSEVQIPGASSKGQDTPNESTSVRVTSVDAQRILENELVEELNNFANYGFSINDSVVNFTNMKRFWNEISKVDDFLWEHLSKSNTMLCSSEERRLILSLQEKVAAFLSKDGEVKTGSSIVLSSISKMLFPDKLDADEFPAQFFELFTLLLKNTDVNEAVTTESKKAGNARHLNKNTSQLVVIANHANIFRAASKLLFRHESYGELIQATCFRTMITDPGFPQECTNWNNNVLTHEQIRVNTLKEYVLPTRICVHYLSKVLQRNIVLHFGSDTTFEVNQQTNSIHVGLDAINAESYIFGNFPNKKAMHLMVHGSNFYSMVGVKNLRVTWETPPIPACTLTASTNPWNFFDPNVLNFGEFGEMMLVFFNKCDFCLDFNKENCSHITSEHDEATNKLMSTLHDKKYGCLELKDVNHDDIDMSAPVAVTRNFVAIDTPGDNHCLFHSISYCLTKGFGISIPLRRAVSVEFQRRENIYVTAFKNSNVPWNEIMDKRDRLKSMTRWGNEDSLAILSYLSGRKIIVFGSNHLSNSNPMDVHTTYNLGYQPSSNLRPIFLLLNNNHFQALVPKSFSSNLIPGKKQNQFLELHRQNLNFITQEHNYTAGKIDSTSKTQRCYKGFKKNERNHVQVNEEKSVLTKRKPSSSEYLHVPMEAVDLSPRNVETSVENEGSITEISGVKRNSSPERFDSLIKNGGTTKSTVEALELSIKITEPIHLRIEPSNGQEIQQIDICMYDKGILNCIGLSDYNLSKDEVEIYTSYLNAIKLDIAYLQNLSSCEKFIRVFMQRSTCYGFWSNSLLRLKPWYNDSQSKKQILTKKAKQMQKVQEKVKGKAITQEFMKAAGIPQEAINIYVLMVDNIMSKSLKRENTKSKMKVFLNTKEKMKNKHKRLPEYDINGLRLTQELESEIFTTQDFEKMSVTKYLLRDLTISQPTLCVSGVDTLSHHTAAAVSTQTANVSLISRHDDEDLQQIKSKDKVLVLPETRINEAFGCSSTDDYSGSSDVVFEGLVQVDQDLNLVNALIPNTISDSTKELITHTQTNLDVCTIDHNNISGNIVIDYSMEVQQKKSDLIPKFDDVGEFPFGVKLSESPTSCYFHENDMNEYDVAIENQSAHKYALKLIDNMKTASCGEFHKLPQVNFSISDHTITINSKLPVSEDVPVPESLESIEESEDSEIKLQKESEDLKRKQDIVDVFELPDDILGYVPPTNFTIEIPASDFLDIFDYTLNRFKPGQWAEVISENITRRQKVCSFSTTRSPDYYKRPSNGFCIMQGMCGCGLKFTIKLNNAPKINQDVRCDVTTTGKFRLIQVKNTARQLKGKARERMAERLKNDMPCKVFLENKAKTPWLRLLHNNEPQVSLESLQRLRHETLTATSAFRDIFQDIKAFALRTQQQDETGTVVKGFVQLQDEKPGNVQIHMYTQSSLQFIMKAQKKGQGIMFVDATGGFSHNINNKKLLLYLAFLKTSDGLISPVASSIAHRGRSADIADLFIKMKRDMKSIQPSFKKPLADIVVTDFSLPMLTGTLMGINVMEVRDYLQHTYDVITGRCCFDERRSIVFICTSHLIKSFSNLLGKHIPKTKKFTDIRHLGIHAIARLQSCTDIESFRSTVTCIAELFELKHASRDSVSQNKDTLLRKDKLSPEISMEQFDRDDDHSGLIDFCENTLLRETSKFYGEFISLKSKVRSQQCAADPINPYYFPKIVELIENYYVAYFPMFSAAILAITGRHSQGSITNGQLEGEFNVAKNLFHKGRRVPLNRFIEEHHTYFLGRLHSCLGPANQVVNRERRREARQESRYDNISESETRGLEKNTKQIPEEGWCRTAIRKAKNKYVGRNFLSAIQSKLSSTNGNNQIRIDNHPGTSTSHIPSAEAKSQDKVQQQVITDKVRINNEFAKFSFGDGKGKQTFKLSSSQLADMCCVHNWLEMEEMDFMMQYLKFMEQESVFEVSRSYFAVKHREHNSELKTYVDKWLSTVAVGKGQDQPAKDIDPRQAPYILHPLMWINHWMLLSVNKPARTCTLYSSKATSSDILNEIRDCALPYFLQPNESIEGWKVVFGDVGVAQVDHSLCGFHVFEKARLLMQERNICETNLQHLKNPKNTRLRVVRELLGTTVSGRELLGKVQENDKLLETMLHQISTIIKERNEAIDLQASLSKKENKTLQAQPNEKLSKQIHKADVQPEDIMTPGDNLKTKQKPKRCEASNGKERTPTKLVEIGCTPETEKQTEAVLGLTTLEEDMSLINKVKNESMKLNDFTDVTTQPFEELWFNRSTRLAAPTMLGMQLQMSSPKETIKSNAFQAGKINVQELLRRANPSTETESEEFTEEELQRALDDWDDETTDLEDKHFASRIVPQFGEKEKLVKIHTENIRALKEKDICEFFKKTLPELTNIEKGVLYSRRHEIFRTSGLNKGSLHELAIVDPFTDSQDVLLSSLIEEHIYPNTKQSNDFSSYDPVMQDYIVLVLKPETMIRIFALRNSISYELAEKELAYGAAYDGELPQEVLKQLETLI